MTENEKRIELLILKYARYEPLTAEEEAILKEWRGKSPEHDALPDRFRDEDWVQESLIRLNRIPSGEIWERISGQVKREKRLITPWYIKVAGAAAVIALVVVAIRAFLPGLSRVKEESRQVAKTAPLDRTVANAAGQENPLSVVLPDGSKVLLNNASKIVYAAAFEGEQRIVHLFGEAKFEIAKDPAARPFLVKTVFGETQDKSTAFNVRAYPEESSGSVTLLEGAVTVNNGKEKRDLSIPLQQVRLTKEGISVPVLLKSEGEAMVWQKVQFHFENTEMQTALSELSHRYGKTVRYEDDVRGSGVNINLSRSMPWKDALLAVMEQEDAYASYREQGDTVYISAVRKGK